jgi:hypothetical protein
VDHFLNVCPTAFGAVPGNVFDHITLQEAKPVGRNVLNRLDFAVLVVVAPHLAVECSHARHIAPKSAIANPKNITAIGHLSSAANHQEQPRSRTVFTSSTHLPKSTGPPANVVHTSHEPLPSVLRSVANDHVGLPVGKRLELRCLAIVCPALARH